jgi:hypothetical protein
VGQQTGTQTQPIPARKSHRCILSQGTKAFLDELYEFSCITGTMVRYALARFGVANAAVCQNLIERAVIEDRTIECFRIPFDITGNYNVPDCLTKYISRWRSSPDFRRRVNIWGVPPSHGTKNSVHEEILLQ